MFKNCILFIFCFISAPDLSGQQESHRLLLLDEGLSQLSYVDLNNPRNNWYVAVPAGCDLQLVGRGRIMIGTGTGFEERDISSGDKVFEITTYPGTISARRLRNGNTILVGLNWQ